MLSSEKPGGINIRFLDTEHYQEGLPSKVHFKQTTETLNSAREVRVSQDPSEECSAPELCGSAVREEGNRTSRGNFSKPLLKRFYCTEKERTIQTGDQFKTVEPVASHPTFQDRVSSFCNENPKTGRVGDLNRFVRCVPACANERVISTPSTFCSQQEGVPIQIPAIWVFNSAS